MKASDFFEKYSKQYEFPEHEVGEWSIDWLQTCYKVEFERIISTLYDNLSYSKELGFRSTGLVGIIGEIAMYVHPNGHILEIGVGTSSLFLTALAKKYKCKVFHNDMDINKLMNSIGTKRHIASDNNAFWCTSDEFFRENTLPPISFAFIDGGHEYEQAKRDFWNTEQYVVEDGYILLHDTYTPPEKDWIQNNLCWDCYRLRQDLEKDNRFDCLSFALPGQIGFTLVRKKPKVLTYFQE